MSGRWFSIAGISILRDWDFSSLLRARRYRQSGGPTALINASACGVILGAGKHRDTTGTYAAAPGSCRCKVKSEGCEPRVHKHLATGKVYLSIGICVSEM